MVPLIASPNLLPPRLVTDAGDSGAVAWGAVAVAVLLVLLAAGAWWGVGRARRRTRPGERAVVRLASMAGLDERERAALQALAAAGGVHESALMLSRRAFEQAARSASGAPRGPKPAVVASLGGKLHPGA